MKKLNKFVAVLVALAMMAALAVTSAFAAVPDANKATDLTKSGLTKTFDVPAGVTRPAATFKYTFTPDSGNPSGSADAFVKAIQIAAGTGTETGFLRLSDVFTTTGAAGLYSITQPGAYKFTVKENKGDATTDASEVAFDNNNATTETVTYDDSTYVLRLYVIRDGDNLKVDTITVIDETKDNDQNKDLEKIDPTEKEEPDDPEEPDGTKHGTETSEWNFTNYYTKSITVDDENGAFNVNKALGGSAQNVAYPFTVSITVDEQTVKGYTQSSPYTLTAGEKTWTFYEGKLTDSQDVKISKDSKLKFVTFPAGATVTITENMQSSGIQNANKYTANAEGTGITVTNTNANTQAADLSTVTAAYDQVSSVKVTNTLSSDDITPEGIMINNLPYIVLALVAVGGLCAYVIVRRKADDEA